MNNTFYPLKDLDKARNLRTFSNSLGAVAMRESCTQNQITEANGGRSLAEKKILALLIQSK
jgi:hypothetical protein